MLTIQFALAMESYNEIIYGTGFDNMTLQCGKNDPDGMRTGPSYYCSPAGQTITLQVSQATTADASFEAGCSEGNQTGVCILHPDDTKDGQRFRIMWRTWGLENLYTVYHERGDGD